MFHATLLTMTAQRDNHRVIRVHILGYKTVTEYAVSFWHALDKAYTKYSHVEPNRHKYVIGYNKLSRRPLM
jgi:hypothetical protein